MFTWKCTNCGAPLELADGTTQTRCSFCGIQNLVRPGAPPARTMAHAHPTAAASKLWVLLAVFGAVAITAMSAWLGSAKGSPGNTEPPAQRAEREQAEAAAARAEAEAEAVRAKASAAVRELTLPEEDEFVALEQRLRLQTVKNRFEHEVFTDTFSGRCTELIKATLQRGPFELRTNLRAGRNEPCLRVRVEAVEPRNELSLSFSDPNGASITPPATSSSWTFNHCANKAGSHPGRLTPSDPTDYLIAVLECPR